MTPERSAPASSPLAWLPLYTATAVLALSCWLINQAAVMTEYPDPRPDIAAKTLLLDPLVGVVGMVLLRLRRRRPLAVALTLSVLLVVSSAVVGPWLVSLLSLATRRRVLPSAAVVVTATLAAPVSDRWLYGDSTSYLEPGFVWAALGIVGLLNALLTAVGFYVGARRDLLSSLRERAETAEREQASRAASARVAERTRIAREMHDVLAHRISTVAMHSGALAYRTDLEPEEVNATARLIQENAHSALLDLRSILGVLRSEPGRAHPPAPEPPQPAITGLGPLVEDARRSGQTVHLDVSVDPSEIPHDLGRHLYRAVQECLTNARKHAPGAPVTVRLRREAVAGEDVLVLDVTNPTRVLAHGSSVARRRPESPSTQHTLSVPPSGLGLLGLQERAALAGGTIVHGPDAGRYRTRLTVPWPERTSA